MTEDTKPSNGQPQGQAVMAPPRFQDQMMVVVTHTVDGRTAMQVSSTRVHLMDAFGKELPQPLAEPLDEATAFGEIMEACQQFLVRILTERQAAASKDPASRILKA